MRPLRSSDLLTLLLFGAIPALTTTAASWGFRDATVSAQERGTGVGGGAKETLTSTKPLAQAISFTSSGTLKLLLTTAEDGKPKRPHQAFLSLKDTATGLETSYPLAVKESGKAKVELTAKDLPAQFWDPPRRLQATVMIASFGQTKPYRGHVFDLEPRVDTTAPIAPAAQPLRYSKLAEIHHILRADPRSAPKIVTLFFTFIVLATLPLLIGAWWSMGANLGRVQQAFGKAPLAHALFFGSIVALESIFFLYYTSWNLFRALPAALMVGAVAFLSGTRALSEVQESRLAGQQ